MYETYPFPGVLTEEVRMDCKVEGSECVDGVGPGQRSPLDQMCGHVFPLQPAQRKKTGMKNINYSQGWTLSV